MSSSHTASGRTQLDPMGANGATPRLVSVVLPVSGPLVEPAEVYAEFKSALEARGVEYEFILVFDAPNRPSAELLGLRETDPRLRILEFGHTFGETAALKAGIDRAQGAVVVTLPGRRQVEASALGKVLDAFDETGADLIVTRRFPRRDPWVNRLQTAAFNRMLRMTAEHRFRDAALGLRVARVEVLRSLPLYGDQHRFIPLMAIREGFRVVEVDVPQHVEDRRTRIYNPGIYVRRLLDLLTFFFLSKFTEKPLRFFGLAGLVLSTAGGVITLIVGIQRLGGVGIANRPILLLGVLLLALGIQLIGVGLVGEIIVHLRSPHRRRYRVREVGGVDARVPPGVGAPRPEAGGAPAPDAAGGGARGERSSAR